jgi:serine protease AprX
MQSRYKKHSMTSNRAFTPSRLRRISCSIFFLAAAVIAIGALASSRGVNQGNPPDQAAIAKKIAPWVIEHTANGQQAEFFVVLSDQADVSGAVALPTKAEKGRYVYETLRNKSQTTQEPILQWLRERGLEHRSFYIVNAILVKGNREIAEALAARPDVARVEGNPQIHNDLPQPEPVVQAPPYLQRPELIEPGINYTHAPQVWALGFTGQGIVVAGADTGIRWTHNAIKPHYRGWNGVAADHNYNWHDSIHDSVGNPCGNNSPFPCDDFFHGTHTLGTAIGDDGAGNQIGMAPGAKWIGCRNMDVGNGTPARYIECMEFFLAPYPVNCTPNEGDPTKAPDITINSWGCPPSEGCSANTLQAAVEAQAAAGIMMVVAAGNGGSGCSTVQDPPAIYAASYSVGALNTGTDNIASFSSRGPVTIDGSGRIKPDITAPGTGTRSASNTGDNAYTTASGTSMATPHISGAMALLWCALPNLRHQITASRDAINNSAVHIGSTQCGTAGPPNNVYGWGRVDIAAAVGTPPPPTPTPTPAPTPTPPQCGPTATPTPIPTPTPCDSGMIVNSGFETGSFPPWVPSGPPTPVVTSNQAHSGTFSGFAGDSTNGFCGFPGTEIAGDSVFYQQFTVPAGGGTLSFWYWTCTTDSITFDWQDAYITDSSGNILQTIFHHCTANQAWVQQTVDMAAFAGQTVRIEFLVHLDDFGDLTGMYVDDAQLLVPCGTPTPTPPPTPTPSPTPTPTATPTPTPPPTPTPTPTPPPTPTPTPSGTPTPTPVPTVPPRPSPGPSGTPHGTPPPRP